jgi:hypothetical protein
VLRRAFQLSFSGSQSGTNWSVLAERVGPIQGPLLGYESTAFIRNVYLFVMPGLDPGIHPRGRRALRMDCRVKPGNDNRIRQ